MADNQPTRTTHPDWAAIPVMEDRYEISRAGKVRRKARTVHMTDGRTKRLYKKILSTTIEDDGYNYVNLTTDDGQGKRPVAQLVLEAFTGTAPEGTTFHHIDGNTVNDHLTNLEWAKVAEEQHPTMMLAELVKHATRALKTHGNMPVFFGSGYEGDLLVGLIEINEGDKSFVMIEGTPPSVK